jgi:hypothetical protein
MDHGLQDDKIAMIDCGDFHSVALTEDGIIKTWGSGILGHGNEFYDSRPHSVRFFEMMGRRVFSISARSSITGCLATSKNGFTEAYIWGYLKDQNGHLCKAMSPALVKHALQLTEIKSITCGFNGSFSIKGKKDGASILQIYNAIPKECLGIPYAPFCKSVPVVDQIYDIKPNIELPIHDSTHSISLGSNAAFFVENNVAKLLDYKSMKIHEITANGIKNGFLASNAIFLASSDSIYSYGFENSENNLPKSLSFFEFLQQALKRRPKDQPVPKSKSTLDLLKEEPKHIQITQTPLSIIASYKEFFIVNKD